MTRLRRRWRVAKWAGVVLLSGILAAWTASIWWCLQYQVGQSGLLLELNGGACTVLREVVVAPSLPGLTIQSGTWSSQWPSLELTPSAPHWHVHLPLWVPLVLGTLATGILFWLDRDPPPHWTSVIQLCGLMLAVLSALAWVARLSMDDVQTRWHPLMPEAAAFAACLTIAATSRTSRRQAALGMLALVSSLLIPIVFYKFFGLVDDEGRCSPPVLMCMAGALLLSPVGLILAFVAGFRALLRASCGHGQCTSTGNTSGVCPECGRCR